MEGLIAFRDCLLNPNLGLTTVDLLYNRIGDAIHFLLTDHCSSTMHYIKMLQISHTQKHDIFASVRVTLLITFPNLSLSHLTQVSRED